jgi:mRNA-degrading endonuclease RelE of RelBE toxin-antitoxin system
MTPSFSVRTTPSFERGFAKLASRHVELLRRLVEATAILEVDPYNRTRTHNIKKLRAVDQGDGQYRLRLGRWRFRFDIYEQIVLLADCSLRREDTYR